MSLEAFLDVVVPHHGRWKTLAIDMNDIANIEQYTILKSRIDNLQPSKLEHLMIQYGFTDLSSDSEAWDVRRGPRMEILSKAILRHYAPHDSLIAFLSRSPQPQ